MDDASMTSVIKGWSNILIPERATSPHESSLLVYHIGKRTAYMTLKVTLALQRQTKQAVNAQFHISSILISV